MRKFLFIICLVTLISFPLSTLSHPGRTDKYGGHTEKASGKYHIHNADGTLTYTTKPTESAPTQQSQPAVPAEQIQQPTSNDASQSTVASPAPVSPSVEETPTTIVQATTEQTLPEQEVQSQQPVPDASTPQPEQLPPAIINETTATTDVTTKPLQQDVVENIVAQENNNSINTIYKYTSESSNGISLSPFLIVVLGFFALIGICMVSSVVHLSLKKIEGKSQNVDFFLYIPFVVVITPAYIGDLLFKAYIKLTEKSPPNPKQQSKKKDNFI